MLESGNSSKRSRRRRLSRNLSRTSPIPSGNSPGQIYSLRPPSGSSPLPTVNPGGRLVRRTEAAQPGTRRATRSGRSDARGFNLWNLLSNDTGSASRRAGRERSQNPAQPGNGATLTRVRPLNPPSHALARSQPPAVTPLVAKPTGQIYPMPLPAIAPSPRRTRKPRRVPKPPSPLLYATRLLILAVGVGAIVGTVLHIWNPKSTTFQATAQATLPAEAPAASAQRNLIARDMAPATSDQPIMLQSGEPIVALSTTIQSLITQSRGMRIGVFLVDQDNGNYVDLGGALSLSAASTIKVPILVAFLQDVDAGKIRLDEELTIQQGDITDGSGEFQYMGVGTKISALETATKMITISDNTATNMIIRRLGGLQTLNQRFRSWGLTNTVLKSPLADLGGTNTTSARDLTILLTGVTQGELLSMRSRDRLMEIMQGTITNTLIPAGIGEGQQVVIAHKTGNIDTMVGDTGIVDMVTGKRYILTVLVQRPIDDTRAQEVIRQISAAAYQHFQQTTPPLPAATAPTNAAPVNTIPGDATTPTGMPVAPGTLPGTSPQMNNSTPANDPATNTTP